jgi:hypothetical protein
MIEDRHVLDLDIQHLRQPGRGEIRHLNGKPTHR